MSFGGRMKPLRHKDIIVLTNKRTGKKIIARFHSFRKDGRKIYIATIPCTKCDYDLVLYRAKLYVWRKAGIAHRLRLALNNIAGAIKTSLFSPTPS